jgi:hypothetical protein
VGKEQGRHAVAHGQALHLAAHRHHLAGAVGARHQPAGNRREVGVAGHQDVAEIQGHRLDGHRHLGIAEGRRLKIGLLEGGIDIVGEDFVASHVGAFLLLGWSGILARIPGGKHWTRRREQICCAATEASRMAANPGVTLSPLQDNLFYNAPRLSIVG